MWLLGITYEQTSYSSRAAIRDTHYDTTLKMEWKIVRTKGPGIHVGENSFVAFRRIFFIIFFFTIISFRKPPKLASRQRDEKWTFSGYRNGGSGLEIVSFFARRGRAPLAENRAHKTNPPFSHSTFDSRVSSLPFGVLARGEVYAHKTARQKISACSETVATQNRSG